MYKLVYQSGPNTFLDWLIDWLIDWSLGSKFHKIDMLKHLCHGRGRMYPYIKEEKNVKLINHL
jgi:hypothetical protein